MSNPSTKPNAPSARALLKDALVGDKDLHEMALKKGSYFDAAVQIRIKLLREKYAAAIKADPKLAFAKELVMHLWKSTVYRCIDEFRVNQDTRQRQTPFFTEFLDASAAYLESLARSLSPSQPTQRMLLAQLLVYRGDLARYRDQLTKPSTSGGETQHISARGWYSKAAQLVPGLGMAHNQLGVVATLEKDEFAAMFEYVFALNVSYPFSNAKQNLSSLFAKHISHPMVRIMSVVHTRVSIDKFDQYLRQLVTHVTSLGKKIIENADDESQANSQRLLELERISALAGFCLRSSVSDTLLHPLCQRLFDMLFALFCQFRCRTCLTILSSVRDVDFAFLSSSKFLRDILQDEAAWCEAASAVSESALKAIPWRKALRGWDDLAWEPLKTRTDMQQLEAFAEQQGIVFEKPASANKAPLPEARNAAIGVPSGSHSERGMRSLPDAEEEDEEDVVLFSSLDELNFDAVSPDHSSAWDASPSGAPHTARNASSASSVASAGSASHGQLDTFLSSMGPHSSQPEIPLYDLFYSTLQLDKEKGEPSPPSVSLWSYDRLNVNKRDSPSWG